MQRDKRGRFVKKALGGIKIIGNMKYKLKPGAERALATWKTANPNAVEDDWYNGEGKAYLGEMLGFVDSAWSLTNPIPGVKSLNNPTLNITTPSDISAQKGVLDTHNYIYPGGIGANAMFTPDKIKYTVDNKGVARDVTGKEISAWELQSNSHRYERDFKLPSLNDPPEAFSTDVETPVEEAEEISAGRTEFPDKNKGKFGEAVVNAITSIDKTKLADFLELTRAGIGAGVNNKIAERALKAEKPFLQDISEGHRSVYGDYRSQVAGEKAAAQLRNMASKPMTSDGALQQQMMMDAQIKGQEYIEQGRAKDDAMMRQTREVAWQQENENRQNRYAVGMQNRQAMLMTEKNKSNIKNMRDSANYSQVVAPLMSGVEQRLRNKGAQQEYYQEYYDDAMVDLDVWSSFDEGLTPSQIAMRNEYINGNISTYIGDDAAKYAEWTKLKGIMDNEILRRKAALKGVKINPTSLNKPNSYGDSKTNLFPIRKEGGTIYRAKLSARSRSNDRGSRSIESSRKIAQRFLEKAIDSLYTYNDVELITKPSNKKRKYQAGGGLPWVGFSPVFATSEAGAPAKKEAVEDKNDLTSKDLLSLLKDMDGLPSDMYLITNALQNFALQDKLDPLGLSSSSDIASRYIKLVNQVKNAVFQKNEYNSAFNQLKGNGGLNELAITSEGMLVGSNEEGDFKFFSPEDVTNDKHEGYTLLTNSNLLHIRANSPDAAFNHKLTTVAQNGIGMPTINELVKEAITGLGTNTHSEEGYIKTKAGELIEGLQDFQEAAQKADGTFKATVEDLYKGKLLTKSQAENAQKAISTIYQTLPENARTLLKMKTDGTTKGALELIGQMVTSKTSSESQFSVDLEGGLTGKSSGKTSTGSDDSKLKTSLPLNIMKGIGEVDTYMMVDRGDGIQMSVRGGLYPLVTTPSGEAISDTSLATMLQKSGLQGIVKDMRSIQFGDQKIAPEALAFITYNNTGVMRTNLPIKADGTVNLELLEAYEQAEKERDLSEDRSEENRAKIYESHGLTSLLRADGQIDKSKFGMFMVTEGYTTDHLSGLKDSEFVKEYNGDDDAAIALMEKSLAVGTGKNIQVPEIDKKQWHPGDWFGWYDTIYKGVIYIPLNNNVVAATTSANQTLDYDEALLQEEKYQNFAKQSNQRSTDADILNI